MTSHTWAIIIAINTAIIIAMLTSCAPANEQAPDTHRQGHEGTTHAQAGTGRVVPNFIKGLANRRHKARTRSPQNNTFSFPYIRQAACMEN